MLGRDCVFDTTHSVRVVRTTYKQVRMMFVRTYQEEYLPSGSRLFYTIHLYPNQGTGVPFSNEMPAIYHSFHDDECHACMTMVL